MSKSGANNTEYQVEYCGIGTRMNKSADGGNGGTGCSTGSGAIKNEDIQPVGGRVQARARAEADARLAAMKASGQQINDSDFVAVVMNSSDSAHHRMQPAWSNPNWTPNMRAVNTTLYNPADRDPCHRNDFTVYRSTLIDSHNTPMAVPDVHKLRYMHNEYMTGDDWYN